MFLNVVAREDKFRESELERKAKVDAAQAKVLAKRMEPRSRGNGISSIYDPDTDKDYILGGFDDDGGRIEYTPENAQKYANAKKWKETQTRARFDSSKAFQKKIGEQVNYEARSKFIQDRQVIASSDTGSSAKLGKVLDESLTFFGIDATKEELTGRQILENTAMNSFTDTAEGFSGALSDKEGERIGNAIENLGNTTEANQFIVSAKHAKDARLNRIHEKALKVAASSSDETYEDAFIRLSSEVNTEGAEGYIPYMASEGAVNAGLVDPNTGIAMLFETYVVNRQMESPGTSYEKILEDWMKIDAATR